MKYPSKVFKVKILWAVTASLLFILAGGITGYMIRDLRAPEHQQFFRFLDPGKGEYRFISPLLECETSSDSYDNERLRPFKVDVEGFIGRKIDKTRVANISVYFRELHDGLWFSIGDTDRYSPASLLKVPLMIAIFKESETDPSILKKTVMFRPQQGARAAQRFRPSDTLQPGRKYTVEELVYRMIVYSDNDAMSTLENMVDPRVLSRAYDDLGVRNPYRMGSEDFISGYNYALFFRTLYNASYLSRGLSEKALEYLSKAEFRSGIEAGVPRGIPVAHKFGEYGTADRLELHDCGIVYYPSHSYILCVMTRGTDYGELSESIAEISRMIFGHVGRQHGIVR